MPIVRVGEGNIYYRVYGFGSKSVVFVHGFCQSSLYWEPTLRLLPEAYRGLALDLKGFGYSDKPSGPYGIPIFAHELKGFLDALSLDRIILVGNSMGGVVCQYFAISYQDRLEGLVLLSTGPYVRNPALSKERADRFAAMEWTRDNFDALIGRFFARRPSNFSELVDIAMHASRQAMVQTTLSMASINMLADLRLLRMPTLIIQGELDTIRPPEEGRLLHEAISGSAYYVLEDVGHTPMLERPDLFHPLLLNFLEQFSAH